jgi:hypothetical protein
VILNSNLDLQNTYFGNGRNQPIVPQKWNVVTKEVQKISHISGSLDSPRDGLKSVLAVEVLHKLWKHLQ